MADEIPVKNSQGNYVVRNNGGMRDAAGMGAHFDPYAQRASLANTAQVKAEAGQLAASKKAASPTLDPYGHAQSAHSWVQFLDGMDKNPWQAQQQYAAQGPRQLPGGMARPITVPYQPPPPPIQSYNQQPRQYNIDPNILQVAAAQPEAPSIQPWQISPKFMGR